MIDVPNSYINATKGYTRTSAMKYIFKLADGTTFSVYESGTKGNCKISNQCVDGSGFNLGSACVGEISFNIESSYYSSGILGATVQAISGLHTSDGWVWISLGVYNVTKISKTSGLITINGSDNILKLDKSFYDSDDYSNRVNTIVNGLANSNTLYNHLKFICDSCDINLGQTESDINNLELYETGQSNLYRIDKGTITASPRDFVSYIATLLGGVAYADNNGHLVIKRFGTTSVYNVDYSQIASNGIRESDFQMRLYGGYYEDEDTAWGKVWYPAYEGLPNSIIVDTSSNLFLQSYYQDNGLPMDIIGNICLAVGSVHYIPYEISITGNPALEVGDCINIYKKDGTFITSVITHISWQSRGMQTLKCVGEDTRTLGGTRDNVKRLSETTQKKINDVKGNALTQEEFDNLPNDELKEGKTYYVY